ncbi:hypothetical protein GCM10017744_103610 [Streptomyces antimycoticus]
MKEKIAPGSALVNAVMGRGLFLVRETVRRGGRVGVDGRPAGMRGWSRPEPGVGSVGSEGGAVLLAVRDSRGLGEDLHVVGSADVAVLAAHDGEPVRPGQPDSGSRGFPDGFTACLQGLLLAWRGSTMTVMRDIEGSLSAGDVTTERRARIGGGHGARGLVLGGSGQCARP